MEQELLCFPGALTFRKVRGDRKQVFEHRFTLYVPAQQGQIVLLDERSRSSLLRSEFIVDY